MTRRALLAVSGSAFLWGDTMEANAMDDNSDLLAAVFEVRSGRHLSGRDFVRRLADNDAVFVGEQHDDPLTHHVESRLLQELYRALGDRLTVGMEMFERDGQGALDAYLAGRITETELAKRVALWPNYSTDYRPLVEFARATHIPVAATNAPQRIVRRVGREGLSTVLATLPEADRNLIARTVLAPEGDEYARRFTAVIGDGHGDGAPMDVSTIRRFFEAQCVRDDTMAESVAQVLDTGRFVLHINGGFHSDAALGTVQRLLWRRPLGTRIATVKVVPSKYAFDPGEERGEADYVLFVADTRPEQKPGS